MSRYYFHVYRKSSQTGYEGEELPGNEAAWKEATAMAGRILQDIDGSLAPGAEPWRMVVANGPQRKPNAPEASAGFREAHSLFNGVWFSHSNGFRSVAAVPRRCVQPLVQPLAVF
jgi:hypothetical protein